MRRPVLLSLLTLAFACSDSDSGPLTEGEIGAAGGTLTVLSGSYAGTSLVVAAGAVTEATTFQIRSASTIRQNGLVAVGLATRFTPDDLAQTPAATVTLVYTPSSVPSGVADNELRVTARATDGTLTELTPTLVDSASGRVTAPVPALATLWVVAPDRFVSADYFPLAAGNRYVFDLAFDNALEIVDATSDPGALGLADFRLTFLLPWFHRTALYVDETVAGGIDFVGLLDSPPQMNAIADILDTAVPLLAPVETIGDSRTSPYDYTVYSIDLAMLPPTQIGTGMGELTADIVERTSVDTPVGRFDDVVLVTWTEEFDDTIGSPGTGIASMWLARGIGPVQIQTGTGERAPLREGTVDGQPVRGR